MHISQLLNPAIQSIRYNTLLSLVTLLGLVLGFGTLTTLNAIVSGSEQNIHERVSAIGATDIVIKPSETNKRAGDSGLLTLQDAASLGSKELRFSSISPEIRYITSVRSQTNQVLAPVTGIAPTFLDSRNATIEDGHFISWLHLNGQDQVAVLGANVARSLFGELTAVGQTVYLGDNKFRIAGSLQAKGPDLLGNVDDLVLIPVTTAASLFNSIAGETNATPLTSISLKLDEGQQTTEEISSIKNTLQLRHRLTASADFTVTDVREVIRTQEEPSPSVTGFTTALFAVSFVVGGLGMMNMLFVSFTKRNREVAIRKAVGATRRNIFMEFLIESITLSMVAALIGVTMGVIGCGIITNIYAIATHLTLSSFVQVFVVSIIGGVLFGTYPAIQGSATDPALSLRYD